MTPRRGNTILCSSSQQLPRLRLRPLKGVVSAQGSETETRELLGVTEDKCFSNKGVIDLPSRQINDFFYKKETEKN